MTASVRGLDESARTDEAIAGRLRNLGPVLRVKAQDLQTMLDDAFDRSRSPTGVAWPPLAERTIARRRNRSAKPLVDTGRLRRSVTTRVKPAAIEFGTNVLYAGPQQFGTQHIPARPFLPVTEGGQWISSGPAAQFVEELDRAVAEYIETGVLPG